MNQSISLLLSSQQRYQQDLLHTNLRHSTQVLNSWRGDVDSLVSTSSDLVKASVQLNKTFLNRIKTERLGQPQASAGQHALGNLLVASKHVKELAACLKIHLKAIVKTYEKDLNRMDSGKRPSQLVQVAQETGTFQRQVRHAEQLLGQILSVEQAPTCVDVNPLYAQPSVKLSQALWKVQSGVQGLTGVDVAAVNAQYNQLKSQAVSLHRKVATPDIAARVGTLNQESRALTQQQREAQVSWPPANREPWH